MEVTVIGLGAMGGGMARSLLRSPAVSSVSGYDLSRDLASSFYSDASAAGKARPPSLPPSPYALGDFVDRGTDVVLIVLVDESQCQSTCFGGGGGKVDLLSSMREGSVVIVSSTVSASWCASAASRFAERGIRFLDCPVSGGSIRAGAGDLTIMASGTTAGDDGNGKTSLSCALSAVDPLLRAMGREVHVVTGGVGMGSTAKMVHQLLAGVHVVAAAEALALAAKAGLDVRQMYDIVEGAAGSSWMFLDRGRRMIDGPPPDVMSALAIFVKDLDIVHSESRRLACPTPLASAALQQFVGGAGLGLSREDDSQVVRVYEALSGASVRRPRTDGDDGDEGDGNDDDDDDDDAEVVATTDGVDGVGDYWTLPDGTRERILEVADEDRHRLVLSNEYARVLKVEFPPGDTTCAHRHAEDSVYFFLTEGGLNVINHVRGSDPACDCMEFGEVRYGAHR